MVTIVKKNSQDAVETANFFRKSGNFVSVFFDPNFNEYIIEIKL